MKKQNITLTGTLITTILFLLSLIVFNYSYASYVIDDYRVCNPENNESIASFEGYITTQHLKCQSNDWETTELESAVIDWINTNEQITYLKNFDAANFHWQFVDDGKSKDNGFYGIILVIPEDEIHQSFYEELGGGLRRSAKYLTNFNTVWTNDGEMFSLVLRKRDLSVCNFFNWRTQYDPFREGSSVYYSELAINIRSRMAKSNIQIKHYVGEEERDLMQYDDELIVKLPKGTVSTLAIYENDDLKGVLTFNMAHISTVCPMNYKTAVYIDEIMSTEKVLYAEPKCQDFFTYTVLQEDDFEDLSGLYNWIKGELFNGDEFKNVTME